MMRLCAAAFLLSLPGVFASPMTRAQNLPANPDRPTDITEVSLEALTRVSISASSFGRKDEELWKTPAAVFVITREDIENSAVTSIPELLRMVPGVQVAQINASSWAISVRGFNSTYSNKLLVLVDGRTTYSEIAAGVHWDEVDLPLEVVERVEVVRGPGAAVWGTNAVNGVINIITRRPPKTSGLLFSGEFSGRGGNITSSYAGKLGQRAQYAAFGSFVTRRPLQDATGAETFDGEKELRAGFRLDWQPDTWNSLSTTGYLYGANLKQQIVGEILLPLGPNNDENQSIHGAYAVSRWEHKSSKSETALQMFVDEHERHEFGSDDGSLTADVDFQNHRRLGSRNDVVWGGEFRYTSDSIDGASHITALPHYSTFLETGFIQDEIAVVPQHLLLTIGAKLQDGTLAGFQALPSGRILWAISEKQSLWAAASGAAVSPAIVDRQINLAFNLGTAYGLPILGQLHGNTGIKAESLLAYEAGYRRKLGGALTLDLAGFTNFYRGLEGFAAGASSLAYTPTPHIATTLSYANAYEASTAGFESNLAWKPRPSFSLQGSYTWMQARITQTSAGNITLADIFNSPRNSFAGSASWNFAPQWSASTAVSYVGFVPGTNTASNSAVITAPAYTRLDVHLSRKLGRAIQVEVGGTNLLSPRHIEFGSSGSFVNPSYVPRSGFLKGTWIF